MKPRTALIIVLMAMITVFLVFIVLYFKENIRKTKEIKVEDINVEDVLEKKRNQEEIDKIEEEAIERAIEKEKEERMMDIENKDVEIIRREGYTQEELDFIANPDKKAEEAVLKDLYVPDDEPEQKPYTQSELDAIANPNTQNQLEANVISDTHNESEEFEPAEEFILEDSNPEN
jgi:cell division protein FtsX